MTCAIHSYDLTGLCFTCGHVNEAIRADQAEADARHREYAKADAKALPPEIESWLGGIVSRAMRGRADNRDVLSAADTLRTAITSALAAAREAGRREVLEGAAGVEDAIRDLVVAARDVESYSEEMTIRRRHVQAVEGLAAAQDAIRLAIAADKARAMEGTRPVLSQADAERLVDAFDEATFDRSNPARAALLAALTGAGGGS